MENENNFGARTGIAMHEVRSLDVRYCGAGRDEVDAINFELKNLEKYGII